MPAMGTCFGEESGRVSERIINYYAERARGGTGLIIVEVTAVARGARVINNQLNIFDDSFIPGLSNLAKAIKQYGASCCLQLHHGGRRASAKLNDGKEAVAPSPIAPFGGQVPRELTIEEIETLVQAYGAAARRAKQAGFDAVEIHGGNGHLLSQFLSPMTNKRWDKYGGDLASRARFPLEICRRVRAEVGQEYPVLFRIPADEYIKGGLTIKDGRRIAKWLEEAGVNAIHMSTAYVASSEEGFISQLMPASFAPMSFPRGAFVHLAAEIKQVVSVPVIAVGRINDPLLADQILKEGKADLISMGRPMIADPEIGNKSAEGRFSEIRTCIACNTCGTNVFGTAVSCAINTDAGYEKENAIIPAAKAKRILIVGGGPGGMEAARVAALRGHEVTLIEKENELGGNLNPASAPVYKKEIQELKCYLTGQIEKLGIKVVLGQEANKETVTRMKPDAVVLATGSKPSYPEIEGIDKNLVFDAVDVLKGTKIIGQRVVVVGAGLVGCETAAHLAENGKTVVLVTRRSSDYTPSGGLAPNLEALFRKWFLFELWPALDIEIVAKATCRRVTDEGLVVVDSDSKERLLPADAVIFAHCLKPNKDLEISLQDKVSELYSIGDCVEPRQIINAIHEGGRVARSI